MNRRFKALIKIIGLCFVLVLFNACGGGDPLPPDDPIPCLALVMDKQTTHDQLPCPVPVMDMQKARLQSFLAKGVIPVIDVESTLSQEKMNEEFPVALSVMDELGIAQIVFEGHQAPPQDPTVSGYRWSTHVNDLNQQYPAHFFLTANGGNNTNWAAQNEDETSYIVQLEKAINTGDYRLMGELEFRHYMSSAQCRARPPRTHRDVTVPIDSANGHRVFKLSHDSGVPFVIHYEPEDSLIATLEIMLDTYPKAKVIWAHFGQLRKPGLMTNFGPALAARLLTEHPNLYFSLPTGEPNRKYFCSTGSYSAPGILDTDIWEEDKDNPGVQLNTVKPCYLTLFESYSDRFVSGADYGPRRPSFEQHFTRRITNLKLIMRDLSDAAKHDISYRNAWYLLTGKRWHQSSGGAGDLYFIDAHSQADSQEVLERIIPLMDQAGVKRTILSARRRLTSTGIADFAEQHPLRITASVRTKGRAYIDNTLEYYETLRRDVGSGRFDAIAELLMFHAQKGDLAEEIVVYPDDERIHEALKHAKAEGWPLVVHIEFASLQGKERRKFMRKLERLLSDNPDHPFALIHMGQLRVGEVRRLIHRHQNIYFLTSHTNPEAIANSNQPWTPMFKGEVLAPQWHQLVVWYPDRFILAFDNVWPEHWGAFYLKEAEYWRTALAVLSHEVAHALAHGNAERLWNLPAD